MDKISWLEVHQVRLSVNHSPDFVAALFRRCAYCFSTVGAVSGGAYYVALS